ncbi:hypothetical protein [Streptococcus gallolyticus]|uniref:hypothetical protein n=1 Tax=Streptococcus gallolyticus TaxID=315405 RepID=UPI0022851CC1|nr:hypothetical protein [Streptococcus gallolyticus]MCY7179250.1 hypothetical protein [Streptococcus gallolyticus subsp. gallolyticus]
MNNVKSQNGIRPLTAKELQKWIKEEQSILEMIQDYENRLPEGEQEQFKALCFGVWNCLDNLDSMFDDNELKYYPKELRRRKKVEYYRRKRENSKGKSWKQTMV